MSVFSYLVDLTRKADELDCLSELLLYVFDVAEFRKFQLRLKGSFGGLLFLFELVDNVATFGD